MPIHHHYHTPPAIVMKVGDERPVPLTPALRTEYIKLYKSQVANAKYNKLLEAGVATIVKNRARYEAVEAKAAVPWYVIGVMHLLECDARFDCHLHNGDPLGHKTVNQPKGRPPQESWTWEDSATDALQYEKTQSWDVRGLDPKDWTISATLYRLESWNGFGSRNRGVPTAYLWSGTKFYKSGKYGSDGKWNPNLVSKQIGAAPLLKYLETKGIIKFPTTIVK